MVDAFELSDEQALITGGGTGIGFGIARCFIDSGAKVILVGRRQEILSKACQELGKNSNYLVHDIREVEQAGTLVDSINQKYGSISILVNNAGIHLKKDVSETGDREFQEVMQTHVNGSVALSRAIIPGMRERKDGKIIFIASMASLFGIPKLTAYSAAKSALLGLTRTWATELGVEGIRVNAIAPGWIESEMMFRAVNSDPERKNKILGRTPMKRFGQPEDIGWATVYLCSDAARFVTGIVLPVDGGASIGF